MRKSIIILLLIGLAAFMALPLLAQQFPIDTAIVGIYNTDTLLEDTITCYPHRCAVTHGGGWQLPPNFTGVVDVGGEPLDEYEVIVVNSNSPVRIDTCLILSEQLSFRLVIEHDFGADCQIYVFSDSGYVVSLQLTPTTTTNPLPTALLLLDTLCGVTSILPSLQSPIECLDVRLLDIQHQPVTVPRNQLPIGIYWEYCGEFWNGRKIGIFGR